MNPLLEMLNRYTDQRIRRVLETGDLPSLTDRERMVLRDMIDAELARRGEPPAPPGYGKPRTMTSEWRPAK